MTVSNAGRRSFCALGLKYLVGTPITIAAIFSSQSVIADAASLPLSKAGSKSLYVPADLWNVPKNNDFTDDNSELSNT